MFKLSVSNRGVLETEGSWYSVQAVVLRFWKLAWPAASRYADQRSDKLTLLRMRFCKGRKTGDSCKSLTGWLPLNRVALRKTCVCVWSNCIKFLLQNWSSTIQTQLHPPPPSPHPPSSFCFSFLEGSERNQLEIFEIQDKWTTL